MSRRSAWVPFLLACAIAAAPWVAAAAGLVPCNGIDCQACYLIDLIQNIINFCIGVSIPIAMALFAWAGILYFTSAEQQENISKAKSIFRSVLVGFIIVLGAYLMVETLLHAILSDTYFKGWNSVECVDDSKRKTTATITDLLNETLSQPAPLAVNAVINTSINVPVAISDPTQCTGTLSYDSTLGQYYCQSASTVSTVGTGDCSVAAMSAFGGNAATMSSIAMKESSCNPTICGDNGFSCGLFQINMTANNVICSDKTLACPTAFSQPYTCKNGVCTNVTVTNSALAAQCATALKYDSSCGVMTAQNLINNTSRGLKNWSTYKP